MAPLTRIRFLLGGFILTLFLSGVTAVPTPQEVTGLVHWLGAHPGDTGLNGWLLTVQHGLTSTQSHFPFVLYGFDWLAFAHLVIAALFVGPYRDPVKNVWVIQWGMIACAGIIPLALICGPIRGIPFFWQLIDCSFGIIGVVPLALCYRWTLQLSEIVPEEGQPVHLRNEWVEEDRNINRRQTRKRASRSKALCWRTCQTHDFECSSMKESARSLRM